MAYLTHGNATQAAKLAGYSKKTAYSQGQRLLKNVEVKKILGQQLAAAELSAARVLEELRRVSFFDIGELFDSQDRLKRVRTLPAEVRAALSSVKVLRVNLVSGDRKREWLHEVKTRR